MATDPDPFGLAREIRRNGIIRAEQSIFSATWDLLKRWGNRLRTVLFGPARTIEPAGVFSTETWFTRELDGLLDIVVDVLDDAAEDVVDDVIPDGGAYSRRYLQQARNRLVRVPDSVFASVNRLTMQAHSEGWGADELAEHVEELLAAEGQERWKHRAQTIARTEAVGAYNAGTLQGFLSYAKQVGGEWEKGWVATEDDRTRPTHHAADLQRVPLTHHFSVGGFPALFPGDPELPAQEVINCRCSLLLLQRGEQIDYSDRQSRARS